VRVESADRSVPSVARHASSVRSVAHPRKKIRGSSESTFTAPRLLERVGPGRGSFPVTPNVFHSLPNPLGKLTTPAPMGAVVQSLKTRRPIPTRASAVSYTTSTLALANYSDTGWCAVLTELTARAPHDGAAVHQGGKC
jgi:hypothetical protein